jgi:hypothetical protein
VLPGGRYTPDGPLLFFAAQAALSRGWEVRQVWWQPPDFHGDEADAEEVAWVGDRLDEALVGHDGPVVVVAKSLGTLAASRAAVLRLPAAWFTPLLSEPDQADVLGGYPVDQLIVIGSEDPFFRREVFDSLPGHPVLVPGDHVLAGNLDLIEMLRSHEAAIRAFDQWLSGLA